MTRVAWTEAAVGDLAALREYIEKDNPGAAREVALRLVALAEGLGEHPNRGRPGRVAGTRELVAPNLPWIIVYRTRPGAVELLRVLHAAMQWSRRV